MGGPPLDYWLLICCWFQSCSPLLNNWWVSTVFVCSHGWLDHIIWSGVVVLFCCICFSSMSVHCCSNGIRSQFMSYWGYCGRVPSLSVRTLTACPVCSSSKWQACFVVVIFLPFSRFQLGFNYTSPDQEFVVGRRDSFFCPWASGPVTLDGHFVVCCSSPVVLGMSLSCLP